MSARVAIPAFAVVLSLLWLLFGQDDRPPAPTPNEVAGEDDGARGTLPRNQPDKQAAAGNPASTGGDRSRRQLLAEVEPFDLEPVAVTRGGEAVEVGVRWLAGSVAAFAGEITGPQLIRIDESSGRSFERVVRPVEGVCALDFGVDVLLQGVVRAPDGTPVQGAVVDAGVYLEDRLELVRSDEEGRWELSVPSGSGVPLVVHASGLASALQVLAVEGETAPVECWLEQELRVGVVCTVAIERRAAARMHVRPPSGQRPARAFPFHRFADRVGQLPEDGTLWLEGLPANGALELIVEHPELPGGAVTPIVIKDGVGRARISGRTEPQLLRPAVRSLAEEDPASWPTVYRLGGDPRPGLLSPAAASPGLCPLEVREDRLDLVFGRGGALGWQARGVPLGVLRFRIGDPIDRVWFGDAAGFGDLVPVELGAEEPVLLAPGLWRFRDAGGRPEALDLVLGPARPLDD